MSDIKRYTIHPYCDFASLSRNGDLVRWADVAPLLAELTRLRSRAAEAHQWEEMAERTGLPLKPEGAEAEIARLREIESQAKAAGFIGEDGKVRKVLGTLCLTGDGCIVGDGAELWKLQRSEHQHKPPVRRINKAGFLGRFYSTREAAEAAREGNK